ncbi:MAG TPA: NADH-quinone oxidoreductase subunit N [Balneolales bacterium]|nr:NADH-quinone oxidoreductase subunit N [Balneolales bacterium]
METAQELVFFLPAIILAAAGLIVLMVDAFSKKTETVYWITVISTFIALLFAFRDMMLPEGDIFYKMIAYGGVTGFGSMVILLGTFFSIVLSHDYLRGIRHNFSEVYALILFAGVGMLTLASANDLITVFIGLETMSICLYVLTGLVHERREGIEASLKYFLLGAFSTGFFLYGIALLYGATGSTQLADIAQSTNHSFIFWAGVGLLLVGFLFKVSAVPFHMWAPDVYQGAPTTITGFMATSSKAAAFVALIMVLSRALPGAVFGWGQALRVIAILTMVVGNLIAIVQDNIKRMLAYSSIAHAGYILVGLVAGTVEGYNAVMYYLFAYTIMNLGAFGVVAYFERQKGADFTNVENYAGLGYRQPLMAILLSIFLFSLAGIPPFVGFIGKYKIFAAAIHANYIGLAIVGVLASAASAYYYLRVMVYMYMREPQEEYKMLSVAPAYQFALILLAIFTIYFGIAPSDLYHLLGAYHYGTGVAALVP